MFRGSVDTQHEYTPRVFLPRGRPPHPFHFISHFTPVLFSALIQAVQHSTESTYGNRKGGLSRLSQC